MTDTSRPAPPVIQPPAHASAAELAERYGLTVSGARPSVLEYTRQLWRRRHFIQTFARSKLAATYANARLGQLWQVVTPIVNAAVYYLIFGVLLDTDHGVTNFVAFLCTGIFIFNFTSQALMAGARSIVNNMGIVRALHFPRASLPLAFVLMQLQQLVVSIGVLMAIVLLTGEPITFRWLLIVPVVLLQGIFNAGLAMAMARLAARTTDLIQLLPFISRTWLYGSGIFYSLDRFIGHAPATVSAILYANPMVAYIDLARYALIESVTWDSLAPNLWAMAAGWAVLVGLGGFLFFWQAEAVYGRG